MTTQAAPISKLAELKPAKKSRVYTLEEYLRKEAASERKHEYHNGKIVPMPYAKGPHNIIAANLMVALGNAVQNLDKNFVVFSSDQKVYFPELNHGVYADTLVVCEKPEYWQGNDLLLINPLLVVEVLSDSTEAYDRNGKFSKYKTLPSFKEYVLVKQNRVWVEAWYRERPGFWHETTIRDLDQSITLTSLGVTLPLSGIYRNVEVEK